MHITAVCPGCDTPYQVSPTLRGQQMRCPRTTCRTIFTVQPEAAAPPPSPPPPPAPPANGQRSGSVGDMVPILPAESAAPAPQPAPRPQSPHVSDFVPLVQAEAVQAPPKPTDAPSWKDAPPVRRGANGEPPRPRATPTMRMPAPVTPTPAPPANSTGPQPIELPPGQWEPPPVRRGPGAAVMEAPVADTVPIAADTHPDDHSHAAAKKKRARWLMGGIVLGLLVLLGGGGAFVWYTVRDTEEKLLAQARQDEKAGKFNSAEQRYREMYDKFPTSARREEYGYLAKLAGLRNRLSTERPPQEGFDDLETFLKEHRDNPAFKPHARELAESAGKSLTKFTDQPTIDEKTPVAVERAEKLLASLREAVGDEAFTAEESAKYEKGFASVRKQHEDWKERAAVVKYVEELAKKPSADALREAKLFVKKADARLPGLATSSEVTRLIDKLYEGHQASVVYIEGGGQRAGPAAREDQHPCILVDAAVRGSAVLEGRKVFLSLSRGVLYALKRSDGQAVWAMRVGIDTHTPPVRVPAAAGVPERILVLSADTETLAALDENGEEVWRYRLSKLSYGRPVVVDQRAFVPTYDGQVHEVHLLDGRLIGRYQLGQPLTLGGVREPGSPRIYFPANDSCVYVLNVATRTCEAILYTEHPAGMLRGEPLIVGTPAEAGGQGNWLVLTQAQGLNAVQLRVFGLPVKSGSTGELTLKTPAVLPGWTSFPAHHDGEKLALLTDAGVLGLYGIRQAHNRDDVLFPLLPGSGALDLAPFLNTAPGRHRSEVVRVQGNDFWVLAAGRLQRLRLAWHGLEGLRMVAAWPEALPLGSPLHASHVEISRTTGRGTLFVTTEGLLSQNHLATAVDDETGSIHWQRQLGLVCQGSPVPLKAADDDGPPLVLALDRAGGLFAFDPKKFDPKNLDLWQSGGPKVRVAGPLEHNPHLAPMLLPGGDGESAFELACPGDGRELVIRRARLFDGRTVKATEVRVKLEYPLEGTPAVAGPYLLLPLADGNLYRVPWRQNNAAAQEGPEWRVRRAGPDTVGHVAHLGGDRFLATDGSRGLLLYQWGEKKWNLLSETGDAPTLELKDRIVSAPLVLPGAADAPPEACVADSGGAVSLVAVGGKGSLVVKRRWELGGRVTAGPFLRRQADGVRVGCVVGENRRRLVWLDPQLKEVAWQYEAERSIVGEPQLCEGRLVVADSGGRFTSLDPATGKREGPGYVLRGSIAPAAAPVAFGQGRLFAPLSDGTVLMLPTQTVGHPLRGFPAAW